jgi:hypothetical protein
MDILKAGGKIMNQMNLKFPAIPAKVAIYWQKIKKEKDLR